ncbi:MAG: hypothetical protein M3R43_07630 [Acidobacteriota bacterium]|nr:hypothetical protein [Acidobacteriota bacterium]
MDSDRFWLRTDAPYAESRWPNLAIWDEAAGNLVLYGSGMPPNYLPQSDLRAAGIYEAVKAFAQEHGSKYDATPWKADLRAPVA